MANPSIKKTIPLLVLGLILIVGGIYLATRPESTDASKKPLETSSGVTSNTSIADGKQLIEIGVKGGYQPRQTIAKAGVPTTIRFVTKGSFDCSTAVTIPSIGYDANLPMTGNTDKEIPAQESGTTLQGYCAMGMYSFTIRFQD